MTFENLTDDIYELLAGEDPAVSLSALCAAIIGTTEGCADQQRALLGVIAELADMVRLCEAQPRTAADRALPLAAWIEEAWR